MNNDFLGFQPTRFLFNILLQATSSDINYLDWRIKNKKLQIFIPNPGNKPHNRANNLLKRTLSVEYSKIDRNRSRKIVQEMLNGNVLQI
ncbi:unnamed protein product [Rhizophagus irregularis]|nr:unnamed protein product [Rhizophagus irregularis]CAB4422055.1 unnamed protein product [Rhizophagus irregularis]